MSPENDYKEDMQQLELLTLMREAIQLSLDNAIRKENELERYIKEKYDN